VVLSDIPAHREIVREEHAEFVPARSPQAIAVGIQRVLDDRMQSVRKAKLALSVLQGFAAQTIADQYEKTYREVLSGRDAAVDKIQTYT
jgi:glycosyltransferase involved in cell wall biosynthesis